MGTYPICLATKAAFGPLFVAELIGYVPIFRGMQKKFKNFSKEFNAGLETVVLYF